MSKGRQLLFNSTLLVASTIFCLMVAEAGLRFFPVMSGLHAFHGLLAKLFEGKLRFYSFAASGAPLSQFLVWARYAVSKFKARALVINVVGSDFDQIE